MKLENLIGHLSTVIGKPITLVLIIVIGGAGLVSLYFYDQNQRTQAELTKLRENPRAVAQEETSRLIEAVGKLVALPEGEVPTVATITDIDKLKSQSFFAKAGNGDKVLIYTQAKKAYLYDPDTNKILEIAPVNIGSEQPQEGEVAGVEKEE
ncbi:hypothetical protein HY405_01820 [Candidatus Microgenomates bacterium]|nr:hypothetical protein [Candidatus Microgenomates bacterium]